MGLHKLISKMNNNDGSLDDVINKKRKDRLASIKALTIVISIVLGATFGIYYLGMLNPIGLSNPAPSECDSIGMAWVGGFLNFLVVTVFLVVLGLIGGGLYITFLSLKKKFE